MVPWRHMSGKRLAESERILQMHAISYSMYHDRCALRSLAAASCVPLRARLIPLILSSAFRRSRCQNAPSLIPDCADRFASPCSRSVPLAYCARARVNRTMRTMRAVEIHLLAAELVAAAAATNEPCSHTQAARSRPRQAAALAHLQLFRLTCRYARLQKWHLL